MEKHCRTTLFQRSMKSAQTPQSINSFIFYTWFYMIIPIKMPLNPIIILDLAKRTNTSKLWCHAGKSPLSQLGTPILAMLAIWPSQPIATFNYTTFSRDSQHSSCNLCSTGTYNMIRLWFHSGNWLTGGPSSWIVIILKILESISPYNDQPTTLKPPLRHTGLHQDGSADPSLGHGGFGIEHQVMHQPAAQLYKDQIVSVKTSIDKGSPIVWLPKGIHNSMLQTVLSCWAECHVNEF